MSPELDRLIHLQAIETRAADAQKRIAEAPAQIAALDAKLTAARDALAGAKEAMTDNQNTRRTLDRDLITAQQRLSKYKEQLMAVKTNEEYHAMQHQISAAESEVGRVEELVIVNMVEADDVAARLKAADAALKKEETVVARERGEIDADVAAQRKVEEEANRQRAELLPQLDPATRDLFHRVMKGRQGIAVAKAIDGHCSICHVRLRPQVFNRIVLNDSIIQCDSCQRILYYTGVRETSAAGQAALEAATTRQRELEHPSS
jgi:uncharacterized protein